MARSRAHTALLARLDRAAREAPGSPGGRRGEAIRGRVSRLACCPLAAYPEGAVLVGHAGSIAGTALRYEAPAPLTALLALDPHDGLEVIRRLLGGSAGRGHAVGRAELEAFSAALAELAGRLVAALVATAAPPRPFAPPRLVEDGLTAWLLGTHAPRDALLLSAEVELLEDEAHPPVPAGLYALVERKVAASVPDLAALAEEPGAGC